MDKFSYISNAGGNYVEEIYKKYKQNPNSVDSLWQKFFEGFEFAGGKDFLSAKQDGPVLENGKEVNVVKLIKAYRDRGHLIADTNPLVKHNLQKADLEIGYFSLTEEDLEMVFEAGSEITIGASPLKKILVHLNKTYCSKIGCEFVYCSNENVRQWLYKEMEQHANAPFFSIEEKQKIFKKLNETYVFEQFLQDRYLGQKRFSLEGHEALIPSLEILFHMGASLGVKEFVLGMSHRGRINVLVNNFNKTHEDIFSEFEGGVFPEGMEGDGDVKYQLGQSADIRSPDGNDIHLSMMFNPSHLEAIDTVVGGVVYAKCEKYYEKNKQAIVPVLIHGDAAVSGQGVVYEMVNLSHLKGYATGGTIHIVLNNQIGFTANSKETRSSVYCTDIAKVTQSPVFHVNADDPMSVVHAFRMAIKMRQLFGIDVWIDIVGYRRHGHNEADEPRFTQPLMYENIAKHKNVRDIFLEKLILEQSIEEEEATLLTKNYRDFLEEQLHNLRGKKARHLKVNALERHWQGIRFAKPEDFKHSIETGVVKKKLDKIVEAITRVPKHLSLLRKMEKILLQRRKRYFEDGKVDWALAEQLAYGTLLLEEYSVRLSGQDSKRGTFAHRHSVLKDVKTDEEYVPLNHIDKKQRYFNPYNSPLSEYAVLGFEYGYSLSRPRALTIWEAQFGDFANGAQIIIDQFISSGESKWHRLSGLVMYLPHGYEGQGPEHSSARLERFLSICAENNMYVTNPTTAANFFHLIRRQVLNAFRKPLVVIMPKSLLRYEGVSSPLSSLEKGSFLELIDDIKDKKKVARVIFCSGKIYYDLLEAQRKKENKNKIDLVRVEQLYPLNKEKFLILKKSYAAVRDWFWVQEEPKNMGAWLYIKHSLEDIFELKCVCRLESASPATGMLVVHKINQQRLVDEALAI